MTYRIVQYIDGSYGIQKKNGFFSRWVTLPYYGIHKEKFAQMEIEKIKRLQQENSKKEPIRRIKKVCKVIK